jgi:hypothetical protein
MEEGVFVTIAFLMGAESSKVLGGFWSDIVE